MLTNPGPGINLISRSLCAVLCADVVRRGFDRDACVKTLFCAHTQSVEPTGPDRRKSILKPQRVRRLNPTETALRSIRGDWGRCFKFIDYV